MCEDPELYLAQRELREKLINYRIANARYNEMFLISDVILFIHLLTRQ
jgi:hypothetical protein